MSTSMDSGLANEEYRWTTSPFCEVEEKIEISDCFEQ